MNKSERDELRRKAMEAKDPKGWAEGIDAIATFRAAANPQTILALLDQIDRLEGKQ